MASSGRLQSPEADLPHCRRIVETKKTDGPRAVVQHGEIRQRSHSRTRVIDHAALPWTLPIDVYRRYSPRCQAAHKSCRRIGEGEHTAIDVAELLAIQRPSRSCGHGDCVNSRITKTCDKPLEQRSCVVEEMGWRRSCAGEHNKHVEDRPPRWSHNSSPLVSHLPRCFVHQGPTPVGNER